MKHLRIFPLLFITYALFGQIQTTKLTKAALPKDLKYLGEVVEAVQYTDGLGKHLVVLTETGETPTKNALDDSYRDAALYAYHYTTSAGNKLTWKVNDFVQECPVDIEANFIKNTFQLTDLDKDGKAEVWLAYRTVCHGDVSPSTMKIIMYEGVQKFAVRGLSKIQVTETDFEGGKYTFDDAFKRGPEAFRKFATKLWDQHVLPASEE